MGAVVMGDRYPPSARVDWVQDTVAGSARCAAALEGLRVVLRKELIDAHATTITMTRGKEHDAHYLSIKANGGSHGLQGEFGVGLLSFWSVGDMLTMTSTRSDMKAYQMVMSKGDSCCEVSPRRVLFSEKGTEFKISPLLEGIRMVSGEKI